MRNFLFFFEQSWETSDTASWCYMWGGEGWLAVWGTTRELVVLLPLNSEYFVLTKLAAWTSYLPVMYHVGSILQRATHAMLLRLLFWDICFSWSTSRCPLSCGTESSRFLMLLSAVTTLCREIITRRTISLVHIAWKIRNDNWYHTFTIISHTGKRLWSHHNSSILQAARWIMEAANGTISRILCVSMRGSLLKFN